MTNPAKPAVVLLSGGLESATVLAMARAEGYSCHCLSVDYGQRHGAELLSAVRVAKALGAPEHQIVRLDMTTFGGSALTDPSIDVPTEGLRPGIPVTYIPARNTIMLSLGLAWAEVLDSQDIFTGVNAVDYSGYPDCRPEYIQAFETMANLATRAAIEGRRLHIHAPLIDLSKAEIIRRGVALGVDYSLTVSCYQADPDGRACGLCDACRLRRAGIESAGIPDPTAPTESRGMYEFSNIRKFNYLGIGNIDSRSKILACCSCLPGLPHAPAFDSGPRLRQGADETDAPCCLPAPQRPDTCL